MFNVGIDEWSTIIEDDSLGDSELKDDVVVDEVGYSNPSTLLEGCYLDPFSISFSCSQESYVASKVR